MNMQAAVFANVRTSGITIKQREALVSACYNWGVISPYVHSRVRTALLRDGYAATAGGEMKVTEKGRDTVKEFVKWPSDVVVDNPRKLPNGRTGIPC
jgi:hypothetical protein